MIIPIDIGYSGRLGNQMFIYATLYNLKLQHNIEIGIPKQNLQPKDCSLDMYHHKWIQSNYKLHEYFNIYEPLIDVETPIIYQETKNGYDEQFEKIVIQNKHGSVKGYFQSWKYFDTNKLTIKNIFQFNQQTISKVADTLRNIKNKVCIHIRLGDALAHPNIFKLNPEYITRVLEYFADDEYNYIIFSDNFEYIYDWFPSDSNVHFMKYNEIESLYLMTQCDHFIISPSTYSWWGAYLGEKEYSKVIAPNWWFNDNRNLQDLILPHWILKETKV